MRLLAKHTLRGEEFAPVEKLRSVWIDGPWVYAEEREIKDESRLWTPLEQYYQGKKPYLRLARCGDGKQDVIRFMESLGSIVEPRQGTGATLKFSLNEFRCEQWFFTSTLELAGSLHNARTLRSTFQKWIKSGEARLNDNVRPAWQSVLAKIGWALKAPEPSDSDWDLTKPQRTNAKTTGEERSGRWYTLALLRALQTRLRELPDADLRKAARTYVQVVISEKLKHLRVWGDFDSKDSFTLYAHSDNLLESFYLMLASDMAWDRPPRICGVCGKPFLPPTDNAKYCRNPDCYLRGARRLAWQKCAPKVNRARREKYKPKKRRGKKRKAGRN